MKKLFFFILLNINLCIIYYNETFTSENEQHTLSPMLFRKYMLNPNIILFSPQGALIKEAYCTFTPDEQKKIVKNARTCHKESIQGFMGPHNVTFFLQPNISIREIEAEIPQPTDIRDGIGRLCFVIGIIPSAPYFISTLSRENA